METLAPTGYSYLNIEAEFDETLQKNRTKRWQDTISLKKELNSHSETILDWELPGSCTDLNLKMKDK